MAGPVQGEVLPADLHEAMGMHGDNWRSVRPMVGVSSFSSMENKQNNFGVSTCELFLSMFMLLTDLYQLFPSYIYVFNCDSPGPGKIDWDEQLVAASLKALMFYSLGASTCNAPFFNVWNVWNVWCFLTIFTNIFNQVSCCTPPGAEATVALDMLNSIPNRALNLIRSSGFMGADLVKTEDDVTRPSFKDGFLGPKKMGNIPHERGVAVCF